MSRTRYTNVLKLTDVRPADYYITDKFGNKVVNSRKYNKGDCSTRCLTYALGGDYKQIEDEQYRIGREMGTVRNMCSTWSIIAKREGFQWIYLGGKKNRAFIATILKNTTHPVITHSRGHACCVHNGFVIDTWDSTAGLVDNIMVHKDDLENVLNILERAGFCAELVENVRQIIKHHRRRMVWFV